MEIRAALENAKKAATHRQQAKEEQDRAARYRDAAKATDEVLSASIQCSQLRVESDGKSAVLVTDHPVRGNSVPYHELSDGERWAIAIDIGADQVGEGGLLVISQVGWEGIDGAHRVAIHEQALNRKVYILTAEAASDPDASADILAVTIGQPVDPPAKREPEAPKPKPAARAAKPKAAPKPPVSDMDEEEIPF